MFKAGPLTVYPFGAGVALLSAAAAACFAFLARRKGLRRETASWFVLLALPLCYALARLGFCLMTVDQMLGSDDYSLVFRVEEGGFLLWGAVAGGFLAARLTGKITNQRAGSIADTAVVPVCLMIAAGKMLCGLLFSDQGIGFSIADWFDPEETDYAYRFSLFQLSDYSIFERFPFAVQNYYEDWCWAVFVLEALWLCVMAVWLAKLRAREGGKACFFVILYACGQILLEAMLRGEVLHLPWLGFVRANQVLSLIAYLAALEHCRRKTGTSWKSGPMLRCVAAVLLCVGVVAAMEFAAFEKKISLIEWMPADVCHVFTALACLGMGLAAGRLWKKAYGTEKRGA